MNMGVAAVMTALGCSISIPAYAQASVSADAAATQAADAEKKAADEQDAEAETDDGDRPLQEDIVVTATRREERLQEVPVTVTAITGEALAGAGILQTRNLTQVVPGFMGARNVTNNQPAIRGVGSTGVGVGDESNVATYIDGVYQADPFTTFIELAEVQRVEVLRGPQGTVFGRNATGGLVNVITPDPSFAFRGKIAGKFGRTRNEANEYDIRTYVTGGLTDHIAADFAGVMRKHDGYIRDLVRGGHIGGARLWNLRGKVLIEPSDRVKIIITGEYADQKSSENAVQPLEGNTAGRRFDGVILPTGPWEASLNEKPIFDYQRYGFSLRTSFDLGGVSLETTSGYTNADILQLTDSDASNILLGQAPVTTDVEFLSQEVRLLSTGEGPLKWIIGAYLFDLNGNHGILVQSSTGPGAPIRELRLAPEVGTRSYSVFAEATYELTARLFVTTGVRYTWENRAFEQAINGQALPFGKVERSFDKWTYRAALRYNFAKDANIYASYGTGFKSGVFNPLSASPIAADPETIEAAEVGVKAAPLPWLRTNLALYHYNYKDLQVVARDAGGIAYVLQNAADAEIYGGELELTVSPNREIRMRASAAYNHGEYTDFPAAQTFVPLPMGGNEVVASDVSGNRIIRSPRFTFNVGLDWSKEFAGGRIGISGNLFHSSRVYWDFLNVFSQKPYTLASGEISWQTSDERMRYSIWATNITNAKVAQLIRPGPLSTDLFYERPRRVGIGAELRF